MTNDNCNVFLFLSIREIQSPLSESFPLSHLWRCVWGPHPFSAIVLEHNCVSMVEFRNDQVIYTPLMDRVSNRQLLFLENYNLKFHGFIKKITLCKIFCE